MRATIILLNAVFALLVSTAWAEENKNETALLEYSGELIETPYWFKDSFLELADDIEEAEADGKKLLLYFHQAGCPYCFNFVQQSLLDPRLAPFIQTHFDVIALNLWGDREVTLPNGEVLSEKSLAVRWKIQYTPTLLFFAGQSEPILRIDGYRSKEVFAKILDYVISDGQGGSMAQQMINADLTENLYPSLRLTLNHDLSTLKSDKPIAVVFEFPGCADCDQFHRKVLSRTDTDQQLEAYQTIRVDVSADQAVTLPNGEQINPQQWAEQLGLSYFPSTILFDTNFVEKFRVDSYVQSFHFNTALEYVSSKSYLREPEFQRYINERAERLRESGKKVFITQ